MRLDELLRESAARYAAKTAVVAGGCRVSYAELDRLADQLAGVLHERGVRRGDRVVVYHRNAVEVVAAVFGVSRMGGVFSLVNPKVKHEKLALIVGGLRASVVLTESSLMPSVRRAAVATGSPIMIFVTDQVGPLLADATGLRDALIAAPNPPPAPAVDLDLAYVAYTSGSTGVPKGVMMTHQSSVSGAASMVRYLGLASEDVNFCVIPLAFDYGLYQAIMAVMTGGTLVLEEGFALPPVAIRKMVAEGATVFPLVPTIAAMLLQFRGLASNSVPSLRILTSTGAPLPPAHSARLCEIFPSARLFSNYGLTEIVRGTYLPPDQLVARPESVGKAMPNSEAHVVDENGQPVGPGVVGELVFRGASVLKGYWENAEATDAALRAGPYPWEKVFYTGDHFRTDDEGYLYYVGRKDDMIKSRGEKVSPKEIENALYALPSIREAAVVGVPHPLFGTAIKAVLVLADGAVASDREVIAHCAAHLEEHLVPQIVEFRDELPKTESGKIRRRELEGR